MIHWCTALAPSWRLSGKRIRIGTGMGKMKVSTLVVVSTLLLGGYAVEAVAAEKQYGPGVTDTEIKIGQTVPYSGPASAFSSYGRVMIGYFQMLNEKGGINGRKVNLISLDNAFNPPQ